MMHESMFQHHDLRVRRTTRIKAKGCCLRFDGVDADLRLASKEHDDLVSGVILLGGQQNEFVTTGTQNRKRDGQVPRPHSQEPERGYSTSPCSITAGALSSFRILLTAVIPGYARSSNADEKRTLAINHH